MSKSLDQNPSTHGHVLPSLDVAIVTYKRPRLLVDALKSVESAASAMGIRMTIHVLVNGPDDLTATTLRSVQLNPTLSLNIYEEKSITSAGAARNYLLERCQSKWVFFLDDDARVPDSMFVAWANFLKERPTAVVVGGPNLNPPESSPWQIFSGELLASRFGAAASQARYQPSASISVATDLHLTSCNLFVLRSALEGVKFPVDFLTAEENVFIKHLVREFPEQVFYCGSVFVYHHRRERPRDFFRQILRYGIGRGQMLRGRHGAEWFHFIPMLTLATLVALIVFGKWQILFWLAVLYYALLIFSAIRMSRPFWALWAFPALHISYAVGSLLGWVFGPSANKI